jgi:aarF domain-containing kinase
VLVESFEAGRSVSVFMKEPHAINTQIVALGVDAYLKMLLTDNFVHTDLHPGNTAQPSTNHRVARQHGGINIEEGVSIGCEQSTLALAESAAWHHVVRT